jgi:6-phosphogluconolactonase
MGRVSAWAVLTVSLIAGSLWWSSSWPQRGIAQTERGREKDGTSKGGPEKVIVYLGTYTEGSKSKGIYRCELDLAQGKLTTPEPAGEAINPTFLDIHPNRRFLYAVAEVSDIGKKKTGAVRAFAIEPKTLSLKALNQQSSGGAGPCHVIVDRAGTHVLAANYGGGSACVIAINEDGSLGKMTAFVQHKGTSADPKRQEAPHAHCVRLDTANRFAFVVDLGLDQVKIYRFGKDRGTLEPNDPDHVALKPGSGPRHLAFHPNGRFAYVINELGNTITAMSYDKDKGELKPIQYVPTIPKDFKKPSYTAEVVLYPTGKFVYGSNRYHDSIAIFGVDSSTGKLTPAGNQGKGIKVPRNFNIDPTGKYMIVANQDSDSLVVFRIDPGTGELQPTGNRVSVPRPVCVRFYGPA